MTFERVRTTAFRTISQTGIHYPRSPLSQMLGKLSPSAPQSGDRFPWLHLHLKENGPIEDLFQALDDTRFNLLVFGKQQSIPVEWSSEYGLIRPHVLPATPQNTAELDRAGIPRPSFYLLRPDGHVALCGESLDPAAVAGFVQRWLNPAGDATWRRATQHRPEASRKLDVKS